MKVTLSISIDSKLEEKLRLAYHKYMIKNPKRGVSFSNFVEFVLRKGMEALKIGL